MEPSTITLSSVEGSALEIEPSVIRASSVEGSENRMVAGRVDSVMPGLTGKAADYAMPDRESRRLANCRKCSELIADNQSLIFIFVQLAETDTVFNCGNKHSIIYGRKQDFSAGECAERAEAGREIRTPAQPEENLS